MTKKITAAKARANFKEVLADVRKNGERVKVTRYGRTAAWLVPVQDGRAIEECADELRDCAERRASAAPSVAPATKRATKGTTKRTTKGASKRTTKRTTKPTTTA